MYRKYFKRIFDLIFSLLAFPLLVIVIIVFAPLIYLSDKGPIFYNANRLGKNGKTYKMYKFRSMYMNAPDIRNSDGSTFNGDKDPRVTKIGHILRRTSIDELPQLINVLKGDMSFIGPRPNLANKSFDTFDDIRKKRVTVRPGITGYSQAYFRNSISQEQKFINDCYYVDHISLLFDIMILIKTLASVILRKNIYVEKSIVGVTKSINSTTDIVNTSIDAEEEKEGAV